MCSICNGKACGNTIPGPGAKGMGDVAIRNYDKWKEVRLNMDVIGSHIDPNTETEFFGYNMTLPVFAGPVGAVKLHYGDKYTEDEYNENLIQSCNQAGIVALTGDGMDESVMIEACSAIKKSGGRGIPTVKPWDIETIKCKLDFIKKSGAKAFAMDIDAAGLPFLKNNIPPAGRKTINELKNIIFIAGIPLIVKGIMTPESALKALKAGAEAIIVSNHGGRVLDQCPSTCEVLPDICKTIDGKCKVFVDGGIRDGIDVFKALAMGADGVLLARPFVNAIYMEGIQGAINLVDKLVAELKDTMIMCGANSISEINSTMIRM